MSQSCGVAKMRSDGLLPTLTKGSKILKFNEGEILTAAEALVAMGFPAKHYDMGDFSESQKWGFVGNSMAVPTLGVLSAVMLALLAKAHA